MKPYEADLTPVWRMNPEKVTQKKTDGFEEMTKICRIDFGKM